MKVFISDRQREVRLSKAKVGRWARRILKILGWKRAILSLVLVNDSAIQELHRKFLRKNSPTDVLAFGQNPGEELVSSEAPFLGDVVISVETARRRGPEFGNRWDVEVLLYIIHGILHLMGFRDSTQREKQKMRSREDEILNHLLGESWRSKKLKPLF